LMAGCKKSTEDLTADGKTGSITYSNAPLPTDLTTPPGPQTSAPVVVVPTPTPPVPPPSDTTTPPPPAGISEYVVVKNDSFYTIAKKYGLTTKAVADLNPGVDSTRLKIGQKLKIPAGSVATTAAAPGATGVAAPVASSAEKTYVVKSGDTLMKIAKA